MHYTREQFTAAMRSAVENRGADYRYPRASEQTIKEGYYQRTIFGSCPTYFNAAGEGTCLIGAAMAELGMALFTSRSTATAHVVLEGQVPPQVAIAATCAQKHQDQHKSWGESLQVYEVALGLAYAREIVNTYGLSNLYYDARQIVTGQERPESVPRMTVSIPSSFAKTMDDIEQAAQNAADEMDSMIKAAQEQIDAPKPVVNFPAVKAPKKDYSAGGYIENPSVISLDEIYSWSGNSCLQYAFTGGQSQPVSIFKDAKVLVSA